MSNQTTPSPIVLLTDFGTQDAYVGMMKGVILGHCPHVQMIDLTHTIAPQNVRQAAFVLWTAYRYFPPDSVFLVVVDPGVGSARKAVIVETEQGRYVGPDNGVFTDVLAEIGAWQATTIDPAQALPEGLSATFHGRDLFAPTAARLACGTPAAEIGTPLDDLVTLEHPPITIHKDRIEGEVLYIDHFGNVVTNIGRLDQTEAGLLTLTPRLAQNAEPLTLDPAKVTVNIGSHTYHKIATTYAAANPGDSLALVNSAGQLEIAVNQDSAAYRLSLFVGDSVIIWRNA